MIPRFSRIYEQYTARDVSTCAHTRQSDVETAHRLIEDEFYEIETFQNRQDFLTKAALYVLWFNVARKNSYKENKTPWEIIKNKNPNANAKIPLLSPVFLDELYHKNRTLHRPGGYPVGLGPFFSLGAIA